jgi:hypothetical protein
MQQSALSQKEQDVLKQYFLKEIQKQLKPYAINHTNYFDGELTITNLETIANLIKLEFEHSAATNRIYLRDVPNSQVALNEQNLPKFVKCLNLDGKNMHDIIDETGYAFTIITQPTVEIEFPMLGGIGNLKLDYVHYKQSGCKYFACDDGENWSKDDNKRIVSEETRATLASKIRPVDETIPYSRYSPFSLHYHGPQLAGVDDAKWYDWEYKLRNTVIGLAYEQINEVLSNIARICPGITVTELIEQLDRKETTWKKIL